MMFLRFMCLFALATLTALTVSFRFVLASGRGSDQCRLLLSGQRARLPDRLPYKGGWLGGDVGSSLLLPDGRVFWIFGDSFINERNQDRRESTFIHNSVGLSNSKQEKFEINYFWGRELDSQPRSFFMGQYEEKKLIYPAKGLPHEFASQKFYWPLSSFFIHNKIFVALVRIEIAPDRSLGFKETGVDLVQIDNWQEPISQWRQKFVALSENEEVFPAAAAAQEGQWIYFFTYFNKSSSQAQPGVTQVNSLARLPVKIFKNLNDKKSLENELQYLKQNGEFSAYSDVNSLKIILDPGNSEVSLFKDGGQWRAVHTFRNRALQLLQKNTQVAVGDEIVLQSASQLSGPWSAPQILARPRETDPNTKYFFAPAFSYAAKVHPWAMNDRPRSLLMPYPVTYVVNTLDPFLIYDRYDLYTPVRP